MTISRWRQSDSGSRSPDDLIDLPARERTPWLVMFFCLAIPMIPAYVAAPYFQFSLQRWISFGFLALVAIGFVATRRTERCQKIKPGVLLILVYFLLQVVVFTAAQTRIIPQDVGIPYSFHFFTLQIAAVAVALYTIIRITTTRQRTLVLAALAVGLTFASVVGILQHFTSIDLRLLFQPPGSNEYTATGQWRSLTNSAYLTRGAARRSFSTFNHPIEFSGLAAATVPLTLHFMRYATNSTRRRLSALATIIALMGILSAGSRTGVLALVVALAIYILSVNLRKALLPTIVIGFGVAAAASLNTTSANALRVLWDYTLRGAEGTDLSVQTRVNAQHLVAEILPTNPLLGLGVAYLPGPVDNQWLLSLVTGGIVAFTAVTTLAFSGFFGISAALRSSDTPRERDQAYAMGAMFAGILSMSLTSDLFWFEQATLTLFLLLGLLWSNYSLPLERAP